MRILKDYEDTIRGLTRNLDMLIQTHKPIQQIDEIYTRVIKVAIMYGKELGKREAYKEYNKKDDDKKTYVTPTAEMLDLKGKKEKVIEFKDSIEAHSKLANMHRYIKVHGLNLKVSQMGNKVKITEKETK